jgi:ankyrin repeat protein
VGRRISVAAFSLLMGGLVTDCSPRNADPEQFVHDKAFADAVKKRLDDRAKSAFVGLSGEAGAEVRRSDSPPLVEAAQSGDAKETKALLARGVDQKTLNEALWMVSHAEPLAILLDGREAKHVSDPYAATAKLLLNKGANLESRDQYYGSTPLILAAGYGETAVAKLYLDRGAEVDATNPEGETALIRAACNCPSVDMPDTGDSVRLLLEHGAEIEARDKQGTTALMAAAGWGRSWIVEILLDKGAQIEARDNQGTTGLLIASRGQGYPTADAVQTLLARGADVEARNNRGESALMLAAVSEGPEYYRIVKMMLNRGADTRAVDSKGNTAFDLAVAKGRTQTAALIRAAGAKSR